MRELSLGEQKKVMVAMELIGAPSRLHFRELCENLDLMTQRRLEQLLVLLQS